MNRSAYTVEITASEDGLLVGKFESIAAADATLQARANDMQGRGYIKTWYRLTHTLSGDTYEGRIDITSAKDPRFVGKALSIASTIESRARHLLTDAQWSKMISAEDRKSLETWIARLTAK